MANLGDLERSVMELLWQDDVPQTANELRELFSQDPAARGKEPAVTTVLTVLSRLEKKGLVTRERGTRPHRYHAVTSREEHTVELMNEVLGAAPDREAVLARFIGSVSADEAAKLRKLLGGA